MPEKGQEGKRWEIQFAGRPGQFLSADGKSKIHVAKWLPEKEPVAVLQMVHGMQEYIERYEPFARYLAGQGFAVIGHDHIGHGASVPDESRWGIMEGKHPSDIMWRTCIGTIV